VGITTVLVDLKYVPGSGVKCTIDGHMVHVGNPERIQRNGIHVPDSIYTTIMDSDTTAVLGALDNQIIGIITIADPLKPEAANTISMLTDMGIQCWLITGDNQNAAKAISQKLGLTPERVMAQVKPQDKAQKVKKLQNEGYIVAMVGDGINDSPALAQADVGIAIGAGTDIAIEAANIILIKNDLLDVITAIDLSKKTFERIKINYLCAIIYNLLSIPIAAGILYPFLHIQVPPLIAAACMALSSISVVVSSLWLKYYKKPTFPVLRNIYVDEPVGNIGEADKVPLLN